MATYYLAESYYAAVEQGARSSDGILGENLDPQIKEKIYLHVLPFTDEEIARLGPRVDDDGNKQHGRLALPRVEAFWIAVEGEVAWPKVYGPRVVSKCELEGGVPRPKPLKEADIERLKKAGLKI